MSFFSIFCSLFLLSLLIHTTFSQPSSCKSPKFSSNKTFENCTDLPTLNAVLHWSYNPSNSTLSMAFSASPPKPEGWVAFALNPNGTGMAGAQALVAQRPKPNGPINVDTYNLQSYSNITKGPLYYNVSSISSEDSSGVITIFATWALPKGESTFNQVWQVGPMKDGNLAKHAFNKDNLGSKMKLSLIAAGAPAPSPSAPANKTSGGERISLGVLALSGIMVVSLLV